MPGDYRLVMHGLFTDEAAAASLPRIYIWASTITPDDTGLFKSTDNGATWTNIWTPALAGPTGWWAIGTLEVAGGQDVLVTVEQDAGASQVNVSTDGGATWTTHAITGATDTPNAVVVFSATRFIVFFEDESAYETTNGGTSWADVSGTWGGQVYIYPSLPTGGSKLWAPDQSSFASQFNRMNLDGSGIETLSATSAVIHAASDSGAFLFGGEFGDDKLRKVVGSTVTDITPAAGGGSNTYHGADSPDMQVIVAQGRDSGGSTGTLHRSTDGGSTWTAVESDARLAPQLMASNCVFCGHGNTDLWVAFANAGVGSGVSVYISTDGGLTWTVGADVTGLAGSVYYAVWMQMFDRASGGVGGVLERLRAGESLPSDPSAAIFRRLAERAHGAAPRPRPPKVRSMR